MTAHLIIDGEETPVIVSSPQTPLIVTTFGGATLPGTGGPGGVSDHGALTGLADDDHVQYLTTARAVTALASVFAPTGQYLTESAAATAYSPTGHTHSQYVTGGPFDAQGTASAAVTAHEDAPDPHPQYLTESVAATSYQPSGSYITISAATTSFEPVGTFAAQALLVGEPTGVDPAKTGALTFSYSATGNSTVTITPTGDSMDIYLAGVKHSLTGPQVVPFATADGTWFISYTASGWVASQTPWAIDKDTAQVALVYINKTDAKGGLLADERHGITMDWSTHARLHAVDGAQISAGGTISGTGPTYYKSTTSNPASGNNLFAIASATLRDEDIVLTTPAVPTGGPYFVVAKTGTGNRWTWTEANTKPFLASDYAAGAAYIQYNQFTGSAWQMTPLTTGQFVNYYVFATDFVSPTGAGVVVVPGQQVHATLAAAQAESVLSLSLSDFPAAEFSPLYQVTYLASSHANWNDVPGRCAIAATPVRLVGYRASVAGAISPSSHPALTGRTEPDSHPDTAISVVSTAFTSIPTTGTNVHEVLTDIDTKLGQSTGSTPTTSIPATGVLVSAAGFNGNLTTSDDTVQKVAQKVDDLATGGGGPDLSDTAPQDLGTAAPGVGTEASRADHVHGMPTAADVGAAASSRSIIAGSGLSGGGDLTVDRTISADFGSGAGKVTEGNDARLSDARTPTAHAASHGDGGTDEIAVDASQITSGTVATARLGSGTADATKVLRGDQTWAARPYVWTQVLPVSGYWVGTSGKTAAAGDNTTSLSAAGRMAYSPCAFIPGTYDRLGVLIGAGAATTLRLGLYSVDPDGQPDALVLDAGTVSGSSPGLVSATITPTTLAGPYWAAVLVETYASGLTIYSYGSDDPSPFQAVMVITANGRSMQGQIVSGVASGGLPASAPPVNMTANYNAPMVIGRTA